MASAPLFWTGQSISIPTGECLCIQRAKQMGLYGPFFGLRIEFICPEHGATAIDGRFISTPMPSKQRAAQENL